MCGEEVTIVCNANHTTFITISVNGYGSHTFERNSKKLAQLGPFNLNLTKADTDPHNRFLTTFEVVGITNQQYVVELPQITCSDVESSNFLQVQRKSKFILRRSICIPDFLQYFYCDYLYMYISYNTPKCAVSQVLSGKCFSSCLRLQMRWIE